eukprot:gene1812-2145_t
MSPVAELLSDIEALKAATDALEAELQAVSQTAEAAAKRSRRLADRSHQLQEYALEHVLLGEEHSARAALVQKAAVADALAAATRRAETNIALASSDGWDQDERLEVAGNCTIDLAVDTTAKYSSVTLIGERAGRLPVVHLKGKSAVQGVVTVNISNVVLVSDWLSDGSTSITDLLRPPMLRADSNPGVTVSMTNVLLLYDVPAARHALAVATLRGVVSDPVVQQGLADWSLSLYTDYASFMYLNNWQIDGFSCRGCGMFLRFNNTEDPTAAPDDVAHPGANYALGVDNNTFVGVLQRYASIDTPRPFLVFLAANISWGNHPELSEPGTSMVLARPVVLVGQAGIKTSLDLGMKVNKALLTKQHSNITFDNVILENLAYGDRASGQQLSGLSLVNTFNLWFFFWDRQIMFNSTEPAMQAQSIWMHKGPGIAVWESIVTQRDLLDIKFLSRSFIARTTWRTAQPQVAQPLPMLLTDPTLYQQPLKAHAASPLAAVARDNSSLQAPKTSLVGYSICSAAGSDNSSRSTGTGSPAGGVVVQPGNPSGIGGAELVAFGWSPQEQLVAALLATSVGGGPVGLWHMQQRHLHRQLLSEMSMAGGLKQSNPDVWAHLVWAVRRDEGGLLNLTWVQLALPRPEFQTLLNASQATADGSFSIPLQGGEALQASGSKFVDGCCLLINTYRAPRLVASQLLLLPDPDEARSMPPHYWWPGQDSGLQDFTQASSGGSAAHLSTGGIAGVAVGVVLGLLLLAGLVLLLVRQRRRRRTAAANLASKHNTCISDAGSAAGRHGWQGSGRTNSTGRFSSAASSGIDSAQQVCDQQQHGKEALALDMSLLPPDKQISKSSSETGAVLEDKRWVKLTSAIGDKVLDIHKQRLKSALLDASGLASANASPLGNSKHASSGSGLVAGSACGNGTASDERHMQQRCQNSMGPGALEADQAIPNSSLKLKEVIGQGSFGTVYRATWQGANVAVKLLQLPPGARTQALTSTLNSKTASSSGKTSDASPAAGRLGGLLQREHMAVQEAAIGSTMTHPNIVAVYSIRLRPAAPAVSPTPVLDPAWRSPAGRNSSGVLLLDGTQQSLIEEVNGQPEIPPGGASAADLHLLPWEMQLVMEYCDQGTLRAALDDGLLVDKATGCQHLPSVLSMAHNVAYAATSGYCLVQEGWVVAKVSDFGLSLCINPDETHVSSVHAGTITHMAPELLMHGQGSKACDVYSYGILLWELATGGRAFAGVPKPLLGHCIVNERLRPPWPPALKGSTVWSSLIGLAEQCWSHDARARPTFAEVVQKLEQFKAMPHHAPVQPAGSTGLISGGASIPPLCPQQQQHQYQHQFDRPLQLPDPEAAAKVGRGNHAAAVPMPGDAAGSAEVCAPAMPLQPAAYQQQGLVAPVQPLNGGVAYCGVQNMEVMQWFQSLTQGYEYSTAASGTSQLFGAGAMEVIPMVPIAQPAAGSGAAAAMVAHAAWKEPDNSSRQG